MSPPWPPNLKHHLLYLFSLSFNLVLFPFIALITAWQLMFNYCLTNPLIRKLHEGRDSICFFRPRTSKQLWAQSRSSINLVERMNVWAWLRAFFFLKDSELPPAFAPQTWVRITWSVWGWLLISGIALPGCWSRLPRRRSRALLRAYPHWGKSTGYEALALGHHPSVPLFHWVLTNKSYLPSIICSPCLTFWKMDTSWLCFWIPLLRLREEEGAETTKIV